jgi:hypothetical protein
MRLSNGTRSSEDSVKCADILVFVPAIGGQFMPIAAPRGEYFPATRDLPPCPQCKRARDQAALALARLTSRARTRTEE